MTRETSRQAYNEIVENGLLSERKMQVYKTLFFNPGITQNECHAVISEFNKITKQSIGPRFAELLRIGVIKECGKRVCSITGKTCLIWRTTKNLPAKLEKPEKIKCATCDGKGYIVEQQTKFF